jgi:hypothetical protein
MDDTQKYRVISKLQKDMAPKDIADELNVSYGGVLKLKREFEEAKVNGTIDALLNTDKLILTEVEEKLSDLPTVKAEINELAKGVAGLEHLSEELQQTALIINTRVRSLLLSIDHLSELEIAADVLCKLQSAFLNKNMTQVNVQNNYGDNESPKYNQFLSDRPQD